MQTLNNKTAIITGAGQGVGRGIALALASAGANIVLFGRTLSKLEEVAKEIEQRGGQSICLGGDVLNADDLAQVVALAVNTFGGINILVNNAQVISLGNILDFDEQQYQQGMDSGPLATVRLMRACHPYLKGDGVVINLATPAAFQADTSSYGPYNAAKEAIRALSRAAASEWGPDRIRVNCILPMAMSPAMELWQATEPDAVAAMLSGVPMGKIGDCETDIGAVVLFLCSAAGSYITGHSLPLDGGYTHLR
ncbi:SDR family NAD(P)-dependent oxidoreductase [Oceanicoccus sagamiensis]|uniref:3-oxoacyl-ACP reductase n=1 Tax=Oceanicoccus sagamiensis TaxID=716816 RepID=A0A1X9NJF5_9GAMM|nr:SDR family oxidoreductase [Oceanicoccus sagamiensis]ARN74123.1 3-oxoacyl-ACP reductase [Oceanicoccus sagamiensis]